MKAGEFNYNKRAPIVDKKGKLRPTALRRRTESEDIEAFWQKVKVGEVDKCWEWQGSRGRTGYGFTTWGERRIKRGSRSRRAAHRLSYIIHFGEIPEGLFVCHHCDNPPCCNPRHLFLGTNKDNMQDRHRKGRYNTAEKGTDRYNSKLTPELVRYIRQKKSEGMSDQNLSREIGVSRMAIWFVRTGKRWAHVQ